MRKFNRKMRREICADSVRLALNEINELSYVRKENDEKHLVSI